MTRDTVIHILQQEGYEVVEAPLSKEQVLEAHRKGLLQEVFGTGTAAVISFVYKIAFGDTIINLNPDEFKLAPYLKSYIEGLRSGEREDQNGWIKRVESIELALS